MGDKRHFFDFSWKVVLFVSILILANKGIGYTNITTDVPGVFEGVEGLDLKIKDYNIGPEYSAWGIYTLAIDEIHFVPVYGFCSGVLLPKVYKLEHRLSYTVGGPRKDVRIEFELSYACCSSGEIQLCTQTLIFDHPVVLVHPLLKFLEDYGDEINSISGKVTSLVPEKVLLTLQGESSEYQINPNSIGLYSFDELSNGDYTLTPSLDATAITSMTVSNLLVSADLFSSEEVSFSPSERNITINDGDQTDVDFTDTTEWTASGNVVIANFLHASGDLSIKPVTFSVDGNCSLYVPDIPIAGKNITITLYEGTFNFDGEKAEAEVNEALSLLKISEFDVPIDKIYLTDYKVGIEGKLVWDLGKTLSMKDKEVLKIALKELYIDPTGIHFGYRIDLEKDINLYIGTLKKAYLEHITSKAQLSGGATVEFPGKWTLEADIALASGKLDSVHALVAKEGFFVIPPPPEVPVIYLKKKLEMEFRNIATEDSLIVVFGKLEDDGIPTHGFDAYISAPPFEYEEHEYFPAYLSAGAYYDFAGELGIGGKAYVLRDDFEIAEAVAKYNVTKGFYASGELHIYPFVFEDNGQDYYLLLVRGTIKASSGNFEGLYRGEVNIPDNIPIISTIFYPNLFETYPEPITLGGIKAYIKNLTLAFGVQYNKLKLAIKWDKDGFSRYPGGYDKIEEIKFKKGIRYKAIDRTLTIPQGTKNAIIRFSWTEGSPNYVQLKDPNLNEIPQDNSQPDAYLFGWNEKLREICYVLYEPQPGQWTFLLDDANIGDYTVELLVPNAPPSFEFVSPAETQEDASDTFTIQYHCEDIEDEVEISLYWDEDPTGFDGVFITGGLNKTSTQYMWDTSSMPGGNYYVYARVDDGNNLPVYIYAQGSIIISNQLTVAPPSGISVTTTETSATLFWTAPEDIIACRIYWTDELAKTTYDNSIGIQNNSTCTIEDLLPGRFYRFAIAAIDEEYNESPPSDGVLAKTKLSDENNPPLLVVPDGLSGRVGVEIACELDASDVDDDEMVYSVVLAPDGFMVDSESGICSWTPTQEYVGINDITVKISDSCGAEDIRTFEIMVYSELQNAPPTITMTPMNVATAGEYYSAKIVAYDADGDELNYHLKAGPSGMTLINDELAWLSEINDAGTHQVKVAVTDSANNETELAFQLTLLPPDWSMDVSIEMNMPIGWSMISLPLIPNEATLSALFPEAVVVYRYERGLGYVRVQKGESLQVGIGYWILFNDNQSCVLTGQPIHSHSITVYNDGWEMIGGCTNETRPTTDSCEIGVIYRYVQGSGYQRVLNSETMEHGTGFWILLEGVVDHCQLMMKPIGP